MTASKIIIIIFCLLAFLVSARAQRFRFDKWTTDNGLPQNSVFSILQTKDGYIWFTTLDGLVRFDGVRFKTFNRSNSEGLTTNRLIYLFAEADDTLWVGTEDGGLLRFKDGKFRAFTERDGLPSNKVFKIYQSSDGTVFASPQTGLARFDGEKFVTVNQVEARKYSLYFAPSGTRYELTANGLTAAANGQIKSYQLPFPADRINANRTFNYPGFVEMLEDKNNPGVFWLTAAENLYRLENGKFTAYSAAEGMPKSIVRIITQADDGTLWMGTEADGLCRFSGARIKCFTTVDGLSSNSVWDVMFDREKNLWVATNQYGINRVTPQAVTAISKKDGLADSNVYPILEDGDNAFWIGTFSALAYYKDGKVKNYTRDNGLLYEIVQSLYKDRANRLWIGSVGGIEYLENGKYIDFTEKLGFPIGKNDFWDIYETADNTLWFATTLGLVKYKDEIVTVYTTENGLPANDVKKILQTADGKLWFGTVGGLVKLENGKFESFTEQNSLPGNHVRTLYEDADGFLWIGTYDRGLGLLRDGKFTRVAQENGLFSNGVFQILPDALGNFWMTSNQGIYRVNRQQLIDFADGKISAVVSTAFDKSDGMLSVECNGGRQPAGIKANDGKLWFPTQDGVAVIDPELIRINLLPPPVVVEKIRIDGREENAFSNAETPMEISPDEENLEIDYTGLSFIKPEQIRFRYRLEGLENDWTEAGTRRTAFYPYLPPGSYTFRVTAANSDGVWNENGASVLLVVMPPFYRTWWFFAACCVVISLSVFAVYRRRVRHFERARSAQEEFSRSLINAHESERRRIAAELHDSIGQSLAMIKNRVIFNQMKTVDAEIKEQLEMIASQTSQTIGEVREISYNLRPFLIESLGLTEAIKSFLDESSDAGNLKIKADVDDIDNLFDAEQEINLYRIIQESVGNVIKHAAAENAVVSIKKADGTLTVVIADDGSGFDPENVPQNEPGKGGFGLVGIAERTRMLGGRHKIESVEGKGTKISVIIKLL